MDPDSASPNSDSEKEVFGAEKANFISKDEINQIKKENFINKLLFNEKISFSGENYEDQRVEGLFQDRQFVKHEDKSVLENVQKDLQEYQSSIIQLENSLKENLFNAQKCVHNLDSLKIRDGFPLLNAKNELLNNYLILLQYYSLLRISGKTVESHEVIKKLISTKILIQKLQPLEKKLDYQIQKILQQNSQKKTREIQQEKEEEELNLKANPDNFENSSDSESDDKKEKPAEKSQVKKYEAPKLSAVLSKEDQIKEKLERKEERQRLYLKRKIGLNLIEDFQQDRPTFNVQRHSRLDKKELERIQYEEENMVRLPVSKKDKKTNKMRLKQQEKADRFDNFQEFDDIKELLHYEKIQTDPHRLQKQKEKIQTEMKKLGAKKVKKTKSFK